MESGWLKTEAEERAMGEKRERERERFFFGDFRPDRGLIVGFFFVGCCVFFL